MPSPRQRRGGLAEDQAVLFLRGRGWDIIDRHVTSRYGEIDILAWDNSTLVAVEVKARRSNTFGQSVEAITPQKLENIAATLDEHIARHDWANVDVRIDVILINGKKLRYIPNVDLST